MEQQTRAATEQIVFRDYLQSVSQVPADYPSAAELQQAYDSGKSAWQTPPLYRVSQIFLAVNEPQALEQVRRLAQELSKKAQAAPAEFAALAAQYSQDPGTAQRGGDSGLQPLQQLVPEVRGAVARLKVGGVSEVVQSAAGFHVLKLTEQQPARTASLDELRDQLTQALRAQRQEQIAKAYLEGMLNTATLSIDGAVLNQVLEENCRKRPMWERHKRRRPSCEARRRPSPHVLSTAGLRPPIPAQAKEATVNKTGSHRCHFSNLLHSWGRALHRSPRNPGKPGWPWPPGSILRSPSIFWSVPVAVASCRPPAA